MAASKSSSVKSAGSLPMSMSVMPTLSRISERNPTRPLSFGSSRSCDTEVISFPPVAFLL
jgi:hypothetical protein